MDRARALQSRFPSTGRDAPRAIGALRSVCRPALAARKPRLRLLGGLAGRTDPKRRTAPAFPQVGNPNGEQPRRKPSRSPEPMAKSAPISYETAQNLRGGRPRARPQQQTGARRPMRDSEDRAHDGFEGASRSACRLEARERELRPSRKNRGALGDESRNYLLYAKQPGAGCITGPKKHPHPRATISRRRKSAISCLPNTTCPPTANRFAATSTTS